jgi:hypothetical protein
MATLGGTGVEKAPAEAITQEPATTPCKSHRIPLNMTAAVSATANIGPAFINSGLRGIFAAGYALDEELVLRPQAGAPAPAL